MRTKKIISKKLLLAMQLMAEDFSAEQAAEILKLSLNGLRRRLERARTAMQAKTLLGAYRKALLGGHLPLR